MGNYNLNGKILILSWSGFLNWNRPERRFYYLNNEICKKNMSVTKENNQLKQDVLNCIQKLNQKDLSIENVVEYIDYVSKIRYTEKEIISALLEIIKYGME